MCTIRTTGTNGTPKKSSDTLEISIDIENPLPQFAQLIEQIKLAVRDKQILPGDPLPSIRQLAGDLRLNNKTVAKAYRLLERDSIIQSRGYRGTFVHPEADKHCDVDISEFIQQKLDDVIALLRNSGATDSEIRVAFGKAMNSEEIRGN